METDSQIIARRITELIEERDITVNRLATLSGMAQSSLNSIFRGAVKSPTVLNLNRIATGLNMSLTELLDFPPYNQRPDGSSPKEEQSKWDKLGNVLTADEKDRVRKALLDE